MIYVIKHDWLHYIIANSTPNDINWTGLIGDALAFTSHNEAADFLEARFETLGHDASRQHYTIKPVRL